MANRPSPFGLKLAAQRALNAPAPTPAPAASAATAMVNPYPPGSMLHATWQASFDAAYAELVAMADARRRTLADVKSFVRGTPVPQTAAEIAAEIVRCGDTARGLIRDDTPRDATGTALDPASTAAQIIKMGRRARGEKED
jgi:hypothetical protein